MELHTHWMLRIRKGDSVTDFFLGHPIGQEEKPMESRINTPYWTLRIAFGLTAFLAGLDKFTNLLTNWEQYASPLILEIVPLSAATLMRAAGVIEIVAGLAILAGFTRVFGYVVAGWLAAIALSLVAGGQYLDVAVRDLVMACGAFTLARLSELRQESVVFGATAVPAR
jgi:uncharacterized membrane protein YphA (DoxX/SURF4 family)